MRGFIADVHIVHQCRDLVNHNVVCHADDENAEVNQMAAGTLKRRRVEADQHLFQHTSFQLSPAQGSIWPGMEAEITVTFQPDHAKDYKAMAYCEVGGRATRLPIQLCGTGLGPKAVFSYDMLDVGEAFINTPHKYEVELLNRSVVCAHLSAPLADAQAQKLDYSLSVRWQSRCSLWRTWHLSGCFHVKFARSSAQLINSCHKCLAS